MGTDPVECPQVPSSSPTRAGNSSRGQPPSTKFMGAPRVAPGAPLVTYGASRVTRPKARGPQDGPR
eukprot:5175806-Pyramimonas_sp.AAC.1